jgi:hypothetical protein
MVTRSRGSFAMMPSGLEECTAPVSPRPSLACTEQRWVSGAFGYRKILQQGQEKARERRQRGEFPFARVLRTSIGMIVARGP